MTQTAHKTCKSNHIETKIPHQKRARKTQKVRCKNNYKHIIWTNPNHSKRVVKCPETGEKRDKQQLPMSPTCSQSDE